MEKLQQTHMQTLLTRQRLHADETKTHRDTNTLNPLKEALEMGKAGESEGWERNRRTADGRKDVIPFHSSQTA